MSAKHICKTKSCLLYNSSRRGVLKQKYKSLTIACVIWNNYCIAEWTAHWEWRLQQFSWRGCWGNETGYYHFTDVHRFANDDSKCNFLTIKLLYFDLNYMSFVPRGPNDSMSALVQIMASRRTGDKPLYGLILFLWWIKCQKGNESCNKLPSVHFTRHTTILSWATSSYLPAISPEKLVFKRTTDK